MLADIPDRYWHLLLTVIASAAVITALSVYLESRERMQQRADTLQLEMAKRNYCQRPVMGSIALQFQPCELNVRVEP